MERRSCRRKRLGRRIVGSFVFRAKSYYCVLREHETPRGGLTRVAWDFLHRGRCFQFGPIK